MQTVSVKIEESTQEYLQRVESYEQGGPSYRMLHTSVGEIEQLEFHITVGEDAKVYVPQLPFKFTQNSEVPMGAPRIQKQGVADHEIV